VKLITQLLYFIRNIIASVFKILWFPFKLALSTLSKILPDSFERLINKIRNKIWTIFPKPLRVVISTIGLGLFLTTIIYSLFYFFPGLSKILPDSEPKDYNYALHQPDVVHLDQGWEEAFRHAYYFTPQGSHIIPLDMALALEGPADTQTLIFKDNGLAVTEFGFVPYPASQANAKKPYHKLNPYGLPLGFTIDGFIEKKYARTHKDKTAMLGMNCAACHTSNIKLKDKTIRIDGNQSMGDFMGLFTAMDKALEDTKNDAAKFERFASRIGSTSKDDKALLKGRLENVIRQRQSWQRRNTHTVEAGHGRVDAFGVIFNQTTGRDLHMDRSKDLGGNVRAPDAPVSFPVLWDTPHMPRVQWNGIADNTKPGGVLGRNFGQVLGVFGRTEITRENSSIGNCSTVKRENLNKMDYWLQSLNSPQWEDDALSELLPALDDTLKESGKVIYNKQCAACHAPVDADFRQKKYYEKSVCDLPVTMVDIDIVKTDRMTVNTGIRPDASSNILQGLESMREKKGTKGENPDAQNLVDPQEDYANLLREVVTRSILGSIQPWTCEMSLRPKGFIENAVGFGKLRQKRNKKNKPTDVSGGFDSISDYEDSKKQDTDDTIAACGKDVMKYIYKPDKGNSHYHPAAYKARPLNGIWASAPYLHNGSVPTLYDMLLPATDKNGVCPEGKECRPNAFSVGSIEFDTEKVGFKSGFNDGRTQFDTSQPGNSNAGHSYGTKLSEAERAALLEYLKSL